MSGHEHHHEHGPDCGCAEHHHDHEHGPDCGCAERHHDHEHGPDCGCAERHHDHEHSPDCGCAEHHHDHECGPDCGCGHDHHHHEHSEAASVVENALIFSRQGQVLLPAPQTAEAVLADLTAKMQALAGLVAVEGFVAGHVKALMRSDAGQAGISITRLDSPDLTRLDGWEADRKIDLCDLSVAVLSLANTDADVAAACAKLYE